MFGTEGGILISLPPVSRSCRHRYHRMPVHVQLISLYIITSVIVVIIVIMVILYEDAKWTSSGHTNNMPAPTTILSLPKKNYILPPENIYFENIYSENISILPPENIYPEKYLHFTSWKYLHFTSRKYVSRKYFHFTSKIIIPKIFPFYLQKVFTFYL